MDTKQHVLVLDEQGDASRARCLEHGLLTAGIREDQIASAPTQQRAWRLLQKCPVPMICLLFSARM